MVPMNKMVAVRSFLRLRVWCCEPLHLRVSRPFRGQFLQGCCGRRSLAEDDVGDVCQWHISTDPLQMVCTRVVVPHSLLSRFITRLN